MLLTGIALFVFNMYRHYDGTLQEGFLGTAKEVFYSTAIAAVAFGTFTLILLAIIEYFKR
jgi:hypothetical protein